MLGAYKIAVLLGSTKGDNKKRFRRAEEELTKMGYIVLAPVFYDKGKDESISEEEFEALHPMLDDMCHTKLYIADVAVLVTPEYAGDATKARISQIFNMRKKCGTLAYGEDGKVTLDAYSTLGGFMSSLENQWI